MAIQCYEALGDDAGVKSDARRALERVEKVSVPASSRSMSRL